MVQQKMQKLHIWCKGYNTSMGIEHVNSEPSEHKAAPVTEKKIHHTHFPVIRVPLRDSGYDSGYKWVRSGPGRLKRVPKKTEDLSAGFQSRTEI